MEAIAIIGLGCRFPGAKGPEAFWQLLHEKVDAITEVPPDRWDIDAYYDVDAVAPGKMNTRWGGFLEQVDLFDPLFFGISPREAVKMDPQQRLLLEVSWEALENAGQAPDKLVGSQTGVFIGIGSTDYSQLLLSDPALIDAYAGTGNVHSIAANRLSYVFDLRGPSLALDTACSASLVAVHLACQSLRCGECDLALAGGVNLILTPALTITLSKAHMMAPDGRCKTFDAGADGYVRGEGCGIVVLKPLTAALRDRDNILALIRGSAVNQDGRSNGLTAPNGPAQQAVVRRALANAAVAPADISYIEAHGTGTPLGDPIEIQALSAVLSQGRSQDRNCIIGSVKTNIGHLETAAGIAGLIKVVLSLKHGSIPPHLHLKSINPRICLEKTPLVIATERIPWPSQKDAPRKAGVSSFGFGGTNCHVVLEEAPVYSGYSTSAQYEVERPLHALTLSARSKSALQELAHRYEDHLAEHPMDQLTDICFTANTGRSHFAHRLIATAESLEKMQDQLRAFTTGEQRSGLGSRQVPGRKPPKVVFMFTGQGSQYSHMGYELYKTQPTFRKALDICQEILRPHLSDALVNHLYPKEGESSWLDETCLTQPVLFALEYALAQLWLSWGIQPNAVIGHSLGEYVAACVSGVLSLEDALRLVASRGRLMDAFHFSSPQIPLASSVEGHAGRFLAENEITSEYWLRHVLGPVHFKQSIKFLAEQGYRIFLEIGPRPVLCGMVQRTFSSEKDFAPLPSLTAPAASHQSNHDDWSTLLSSLVQLYIRGVEVDWEGFDHDYQRRKVPLPTYPFERQRYWFEATSRPVTVRRVVKKG